MRRSKIQDPRSNGDTVERVPTASEVVSPLDILLPYQRRWVDDESRFKIGLAARQTGKSMMCAGEAVRDCLRKPKNLWVILSRGERQALEFLRKAKEWAKAFQFTVENYVEDRESAQALIKSAEIEWQNGSRMIAIPANPDTAAGYSANLCLDEFALHEKPAEIWRAIYPSITNPLRGVWKVRIISTPRGLGNKFADLWHKDNRWSKHRVSIHDAVAQGLPVNVEELREGMDDAEGWAQEFELEFIDSAAVLLPYELLTPCENGLASVVAPSDFWQPNARGLAPIDLGIDFGRKRDLTCCWALEALGGVFGMTREVLTLAKVSTPDQEKLLIPRIERARRVCLDYSGPGIGLGDYLVKRFGEWNPEQDKFGKIELVTFSNSIKQEVFPKLKMRFEAKTLGVPIDVRVREDLHSVNRVTTPSGLITYQAVHSEDGHADRCVALALAVRAASQAGGSFAFTPVKLGQGFGGGHRMGIGVLGASVGRARQKGVLV